MPKRLTDSELWDKDWFMDLKPRLKCLVKLIRDKCDMAGIWNPNWSLASNYIGEKVSEKDLLNIDKGRQFKKLQNGKFYCLGFIQFQYGEINENPTPEKKYSPIHKKILKVLASHGLKLETLKSFDLYPIDTLSEKKYTLEEEEEVKEERKEEAEEVVKVEEGTAAVLEMPTFEKFIEMFNAITGRNYRGGDGQRSQFNARQNEGFTMQQMGKAIYNCCHDEYHVKTNLKYLTPEFILRVDKLEKFLNMEPKIIDIQQQVQDQFNLQEIARQSLR